MPVEFMVHAPSAEGARNYAEVADTLRPLPDAHEEGYDFTYRDEEAALFFVVTPGHAGPEGRIDPGPDASGRCDRLRIRVPDELIPTTREPLAEFVFTLARRFHWEVSEEQARYPDEAALVRRLGGALQSPRPPNSCTTLLLIAMSLISLAILIYR